MGGAGRTQAHPIDGCTLTVELQKFDMLYTNILPSNVSVIAINIFCVSYTASYTVLIMLYEDYLCVKVTTLKISKIDICIMDRFYLPSDVHLRWLSLHACSRLPAYVAIRCLVI